MSARARNNSIDKIGNNSYITNNFSFLLLLFFISLSIEKENAQKETKKLKKKNVL